MSYQNNKEMRKLHLDPSRSFKKLTKKKYDGFRKENMISHIIYIKNIDSPRDFIKIIFMLVL